MSATAARYADYGSACPRCQQIINTIDITFQQGIFIYDLTFIQQELESVLVAAIERQKQLLHQDGADLKLPSSSMIRLPNGKKPRDFKAERERRRKALSGHVSRKRRMKKSSTVHLLKTSNQERNENGFASPKKHSESNGNSARSARSYRSMNFAFPDQFEATQLPHLSSNKFQINTIINPDQFWTKILANQQEFLKKNDWNYLDKLLEIDQSFLDNLDCEKEYNQHKQFINSKEYLFSEEKYLHPELECSIALKRNSRFYDLVEKMLKTNQRKNGTGKSKRSGKRKRSAISNHHDSTEIDHSVLDFFRRDNK